jgi:curved DNA-binding protein CbpA
MSHYEILEVAEHATIEVINAAWKTLQRRYHESGSEPDGEKARLINNAHDVLEDPEQRRRYDLSLRQQRAADQREMASAEPSHDWLNRQFNQGSYPSPYPPDILQMAAMRLGANVLGNLLAQNPELDFLIKAAMARRGRA